MHDPHLAQLVKLDSTGVTDVEQDTERQLMSVDIHFNIQLHLRHFLILCHIFLVKFFVLKHLLILLSGGQINS